MELVTVPVETPGDHGVVIGQSPFVGTVEDLHEALAGASPLGVEAAADVEARRGLLRPMGCRR